MPCSRVCERRGHVCRCVEHGRNRWDSGQQSAAVSPSRSAILAEEVSRQAILAEEVSQQALLAHHQSAVQHEGGLNHQQLPHHSKQSGNQHCPKVSDQAAAVAAADGLTEQASMMIAKMQELADSANVAASAAKEAVEQLAEIKKQSNGSFRSAASDAGNGAKQDQPAAPPRLTEETLREHTRSQRAASPQGPLLPGLEAAAAAKAGGPAPGGIGRGWRHYPAV